MLYMLVNLILSAGHAQFHQYLTWPLVVPTCDITNSERCQDIAVLYVDAYVYQYLLDLTCQGAFCIFRDTIDQYISSL